MKRTPIKLTLRKNEIEYLLKLQTEIRLKKYKAKFEAEPSEVNKFYLQEAIKDFNNHH